MKKCKLCFVNKTFDEYHIDNKKKDGHYDVCKSCRKIKSKNDYEKIKITDKKEILGKICTKCLEYKRIRIILIKINININNLKFIFFYKRIKERNSLHCKEIDKYLMIKKKPF